MNMSCTEISIAQLVLLLCKSVPFLRSYSVSMYIHDIHVQVYPRTRISTYTYIHVHVYPRISTFIHVYPRVSMCIQCISLHLGTLHIALCGSMVILCLLLHCVLHDRHQAVLLNYLLRLNKCFLRLYQMLYLSCFSHNQ